MALDPLTAGLDLGKTIIDKMFPDAGEAEKAKMQQVITVFTAQAEIVKAEAQSENWLTAAWRPVTMLTFTALIVARWLGFSAPGISDAEVLKLWDIVQLGLGGYVIGRTFEKVVPQVAEAIKR